MECAIIHLQMMWFGHGHSKKKTEWLNNVPDTSSMVRQTKETNDTTITYTSTIDKLTKSYSETPNDEMYSQNAK